MISDKRLETALTYLASTDWELADLKTSAERGEYIAKKTKAEVFQHSKGTVAERTAKAESSEEYAEAMGNYFKLRREALAIEYKRRTEHDIVEVWRSLNANRRVGNVT